MSNKPILIDPSQGELLGEGNLTKDDMTIINEWLEWQAHALKHMPKDLSNKVTECDGLVLVHDYECVWLDLLTGEKHTFTLGGLSDAHAWDEASYELADEAEHDDVEIVSVTQLLPTGQVI